jgi:hypothetical protein
MMMLTDARCELGHQLRPGQECRAGRETGAEVGRDTVEPAGVVHQHGDLARAGGSAQPDGIREAHVADRGVQVAAAGGDDAGDAQHVAAHVAVGARRRHHDEVVQPDVESFRERAADDRRAGRVPVAEVAALDHRSHQPVGGGLRGGVDPGDLHADRARAERQQRFEPNARGGHPHRGRVAERCEDALPARDAEPVLPRGDPLGRDDAQVPRAAFRRRLDHHVPLAPHEPDHEQAQRAAHADPEHRQDAAANVPAQAAQGIA